MSALDLHRSRPLLLGVVHLRALPGAPRYGVLETGDLAAVLAAAEADAVALAEGGADGLVVENFGDAPFHGGAVAPETVAALALAIDRVARRADGLPVGVNVLRNDARAALGLCASTPASFLRVNVHTGAMWTDQGLLQGRAAETLRERARLCPDALLLADVHVKHATPVAGERIEDAARDAFERGLADALVVSGAGTGSPTAASDLARVAAACPGAPLLVGSGLRPENAAELVPPARGGVVGTALARGGAVGEPVDPGRVRAVRTALDACPG